MKINVKALIKEQNIFYLFLAFSIIPLAFYKFYTCLDGPQHLYNSNVIVQLLKGNEFFHEYFKINPIIVGYWSGHFILALYNFFLPALIAEKLFVITYIIGMAYSFKYLIESITKRKTFLVVLIFPFIFSMYFLLGYYSFSIAFIAYFLLIGYLVRVYDNISLRNLLILIILFLFSFLSHAFVFALTCFSIFIYYTLDILFSIIKKESPTLKIIIKRGSLILISAIPAIILWIIYIKHVMLIDSTVRPLTYTFKELIIFILRLRQLVGFVHEKESIGNIMIFVSLMILLIYLIINRLNKLKTYKQQLFFNRCNIWLFISFFFLVLYFTVPDRISAGSLTNRIGLFFFINLIIGLAIKQYNKKVLLFALIIFFSGYSYLQIYRMRFYPRQNKFVDCIKQVEEYIEPNSTIYHIRDSWNWIDSHFALYLGIDKPILNIRNTQNHGQFPVVWNYSTIPKNFLGSKEIIRRPPKFISDTSLHRFHVIDYFLVYKTHKPKENLDKKNQYILDNYYDFIFASDKNYAQLYKRKELDLNEIIDSLKTTLNEKQLIDANKRLQLYEEDLYNYLALMEYDRKLRLTN